MIVRPDVINVITSNFSGKTEKAQSNKDQENIMERPISGEAKTPMAIDNEDIKDNKLEKIKQKIENNSYPVNLDSTSEKMAQELLQR